MLYVFHIARPVRTTRADGQRIAPLIQHAQPMLNEILTKTSEINQALGARAVQTVQTSKEYSEHLVEQLKAIAKQGNGLPAQLVEVSFQARFRPLKCN